MEQFFTSLSKRQTMLLLTGVTFGGQDCLGSFDFLDEYEAELLKYRAQDLLQIPREKRIPLLVQEIKRLVTQRPTELYLADPAKLAEALRYERAATRDILINAFPEALAEAVRVYLPPPTLRPNKKVRADLIPILRWRLEEVLRAAGARRAHFKFSDVLLLQTRELLTLCDHVGARALGPAVAGLVTADREELFSKLPPDLRKLAERAIEQTGDRKLADADAKDVLALHAGERGGPEVIRSAGAQRLARACLAQSPEFAARLVERQRGEFGALLVKWVREERAKAVNRGDGGRTEVVEEMESLEQAGLINKPLRMPAAPKKPAQGKRPSPPPERADRPERPPQPVAGGARPPSARVPVAAQARGASASSVFKAAAEAAAPRQSHSDWMAEREKRKAGISSQWNMPRPISAGIGASEPAITIPPHLVKKNAPAQPAAARQDADERTNGRPSRPSAPMYEGVKVSDPVVQAELTPPDDLSQERTTPPRRASSAPEQPRVDPAMQGPQRSKPRLAARPAPSKPLGQYDVTGPMPQREPSQRMGAARPPSRQVPQVEAPPTLGERPRTSPALQKMPLKKSAGTSVSRMPRVVGHDEVTDPGSGSGSGSGREKTDPSRDDEER